MYGGTAISCSNTGFPAHWAGDWYFTQQGYSFIPLSASSLQDPPLPAVCQMGNCSWVGGFHGDQPQLLMCQAYAAHTQIQTHKCDSLQCCESSGKQHWFPHTAKMRLRNCFNNAGNNYLCIRANSVENNFTVSQTTHANTHSWLCAIYSINFNYS